MNKYIITILLNRFWVPGRILLIIQLSEQNQTLKNGGQRGMELYLKIQKENGGLCFMVMKKDFTIWDGRLYFCLSSGQKMAGIR